MEYVNEIVPIKGIHCVSCVSIIERTLSELDGVEEVNVNFSAKNANIKYDASKVNIMDIERELKSIGYEIGKEKSLFDKIKDLFKK